MRTPVICYRFTATVFFLVFLGGGLFAQRQIDSGDPGNADKMLYHARQDYMLALKMGDTASLVTYGSTLAQLYSRLNMPDSVRLISERILLIARRNNLQKEIGCISEN